VGHQRLNDLTISLISPQGTSVEIQDQLLKPSANAFSAQGLAFQEFEGENPQGDWKIRVVDGQAGSVGELNGVVLSFSGRTFPTYLTYNAGRLLIAASDAAGERLFANTYDGRARVIAQDDGRDDTPLSSFVYADTPSGGALTTYTDRTGVQQVFEHDSKYRLLGYVNPLGAQTVYTYNANGERTSIKDPMGRMTQFSYDSNGNLITVVDAALNTSQMSYDSQRNLTRFTDAAGRETAFNYGGGTANVTRVQDALGHRTDKQYGGNGQLVQNLLDDGAGVQYTYAGGMITGARRLDAGGSKIEKTDYDALGYPTSLTDAEGRETQLKYDERLNVVERTNPLGSKETKQFDVRNRLTRIVDFNGNQSLLTYDGNNNVVARTNTLGDVSIFLYDAEDKLIQAIDPLGRSTRTEYDAAGRVFKKEYFSDDVVQSISDAAGRKTFISYDQANRVRQIEPPAGSIARVEFNWDEAYQLTQDRLPGGTRRDYQYDDAGRMTKISYVGSGSPGNRNFVYDANGNLLRINVDSGGLDPSGNQLQREYDSLDRVTKFTDIHGTSLRYVYDASGNLTKLTYPDGKVLNYLYNEANQLVEVVDWSNRRTKFGYDADSRVTSIQFPNGVMRLMEYDAGGRLKRRRDVRSTGAVIVEYLYDYDEQGQVSVESGGPGGPPYLPTAMTMTHQFDGRLATVNGASVQYDARHNITSAPLDGAQHQFEYNLNNRLVEVDGFKREYDAADNLTASNGPNGRTRLSVNPHAGLPQVVMTRDPNGATHYYVYAGGLLYDEVGGDIRIYHYDYRGNTVAFSDGSGSVVGTVSYGPFGEIAGGGPDPKQAAQA